MTTKTTQQQSVATCYASPTKVLVESKVVIEPAWIPFRARRDEKKRAEWLSGWAVDLNEFFRDRRSMDVNSVTVERLFETRCDKCGEEWETYQFEADGDEPSFLGCLSCGEPVNVEPQS